MNDMLEQMLKNYSADTLTDRKSALKEIMQKLALCGLSRAGFFDQTS